jgi:hypothetical protein
MEDWRPQWLQAVHGVLFAEGNVAEGTVAEGIVADGTVADGTVANSARASEIDFATEYGLCQPIQRTGTPIVRAAA